MQDGDRIREKSLDNRRQMQEGRSAGDESGRHGRKTRSYRSRVGERTEDDKSNRRMVIKEERAVEGLDGNKLDEFPNIQSP